MSNKVIVTLNVDEEVKGIADALTDIVKDIEAKAAIGQYLADITKDLAPVLGSIGNLSADLKSNEDNYAYLGAALARMAKALLSPAAAPAVAAPAPATP